MRILVVEDNLELGQNLRKGLREHGFIVDLANRGDLGLDYTRAGTYDLLILDRMLPVMDGLELLKKLRELSISTPAIFLTARSAVSERIEGFDAGADDYIVKPFSFAELLARIRVVLRRGQSVAPVTILKVADLTLDPVTRIVERSANRIELSAKQFSLLEYLMRHAGQVVSRSMILEKVWDFEFDSLTNVVEVHINRLRNKVDRDYEHPLIHTLRGVGYVLKEKS